MLKIALYILFVTPVLILSQNEVEVIYSKKEVRKQLSLADSIFDYNNNQAFAIVNKTLNHSILNSDKREEALCYKKLGEFYIKKKNYKEATKHLDIAINYIELFGSKEELIKLYKLSAENFEKINELENAISRYISLKNELIGQGKMIEAIHFKIKVGYLFLKQGNIEDAKIYFDYSYLYSDEEGSYKQMIESLIGLGKIEEYLGNRYESKLVYKKALYLSKENNYKELIKKLKGLLKESVLVPETLKDSINEEFYKKSLASISEKVEQLEQEREQKKAEINYLKKEQDLNTKEIQLLKKEKQLDLAKVKQQRKRTTYLFIVIAIILGLSFFLFRSIYQKQKAYKTLELKSLRIQMNPHFIFNSLNAVNSYISKNDERSANRFLTRFSSLMREVMESSKKEFVSLSEELNMLQNYTTLEHSRFKDKFDYQFNINKSILLDDFVIPPMLIQPYIENSIWHGLRYKKQKGKLIISVNQTETSIIIEIEDNGIGRIASEKAKTKNQKQHQSTGMDNISSRIDLINKLYKSNIKVEITDFEEPNSGTKVNLSLDKNTRIN